jgi:hypothetical protein
MTLEFFVGYLLERQRTKIPRASLSQEVLSILRQDPLIELILTGVEILKIQSNFKYGVCHI